VAGCADRGQPARLGDEFDAWREQQALRTRAAPITAWQFLGTPDFWFQSMQNWQSEFVSIGCLVVLGIVLRQHGSPESKPVAAPHRQTG
jgi:hypothetical protein